jgi:serine/threonine protein kinase
MIGQIIHSYEIKRLIDKGGMGEVYLGQHVKLNRQVAIKMIQPHLASQQQVIARFEREAQILSELHHPNIVQLIDYFEDHRGLFLIEEFVHGETLEVYVGARMGALPEEFLRPLFLQILSALEHAHSKGMIHRDIKPSNIMVGLDGHVKVLDFGIAKILGSSYNLTTSKSQVGTVAFMSPEQILNQGVDTRTDIFSLGITLFYVATGIHPFPNADSEFELSNCIVNKTLPIPQSINPGVTERIANIIRKATQKHAMDRYRSCAAMAEDFTRPQQLREQGNAQISNDSNTHDAIDTFESRSGSGNYTLRIWAVSFFILAAVAVIWVLYGRNDEPQPDEFPKYTKQQIETWPERNRESLKVGLHLADFEEGTIFVNQPWAYEQNGGTEVHVQADTMYAITHPKTDDDRAKNRKRDERTANVALMKVGYQGDDCACVPGDIFMTREEFYQACLDNAYKRGCAFNTSDFNAKISGNHKAFEYCWPCKSNVKDGPQLNNNFEKLRYETLANNSYSVKDCLCDECQENKANCLKAKVNYNGLDTLCRLINKAKCE